MSVYEKVNTRNVSSNAWQPTAHDIVPWALHLWFVSVFSYFGSLSWLLTAPSVEIYSYFAVIRHREHTFNTMVLSKSTASLAPLNTQTHTYKLSLSLSHCDKRNRSTLKRLCDLTFGKQSNEFIYRHIPAQLTQQTTVKQTMSEREETVKLRHIKLHAQLIFNRPRLNKNKIDWAWIN